MIEAKSSYCGECQSDFKPGQIVYYAWIENRSFCGKCHIQLRTLIQDWETRQVPKKEA
ncbi:hypothetical protein OR571_13410 [Psychrobacillus sp. NEAU-3TGS]|uniref:hypothetical protein n=1 Tax=Psychrobacillus sp. NEAU-3TGS TaxID=2995412 RepID=UPI002495B66B|nr:hypothetical protein [Psychrobacillus sp. NEAU-3TGS]MDI2588086.1 hypothetical protein [Psychrobacillus sp. NEAU-3TGS]